MFLVNLWESAFEILHDLDPRILAMITAVIGLVLKPVTVRGSRALWWGIKQTGNGVRWLVITPEPTAATSKLLRALDWTDQWVLKDENNLFSSDGLATLNLHDKQIRKAGVDITNCFVRCDRRRIMKKAKSLRNRLQTKAQELAMLSLRN